MLRYYPFTHISKCISSHRSALHLLFNCLALESFGNCSFALKEIKLIISLGSAAYYYLLKEQNNAEQEVLESTTSYHFLAFFLSGKPSVESLETTTELFLT